jgi:hypothetical protein
VDFSLHPAIRPGQPNISGCEPTEFECPDEDCGCPFTTWALCALHATNTTQTQQVEFMSCFDAANTAWSNDWVTDGDMKPPNVTALKCVNQTGIDYNAVLECAAGNQSEQLKQVASNYFITTFPALATGPRFMVPHLYIDIHEQELMLDGKDMWNITDRVCKEGANLALCTILPNQNPVLIA